jgi:predicted TIM-barrel fold metal-dependent hydrolase
LSAAAGAPAHRVVRLETVAEQLAGRAPAAADWAAALTEALVAELAGAVAVKSVLAYRGGLDIPAERPTPAQVVEAAGRFLAAAELATGPARLTDRVLLRHLLWTAVDLCAQRHPALPVQLHTGFGDPDLTLHHCDPALLTPFIRAAEPSGVPLVLLHCYPYHRQAGYLAQVFPHVHTDTGLTLNHVGPRATTVLGELLELAPFGKVLASTDGYGLPELHLTGAAQFHHAIAELTWQWRRANACTAHDAERLARLLAEENARALYGV